MTQAEYELIISVLLGYIKRLEVRLNEAQNNNNIESDYTSYRKPHNEVQKLKQFMEIFNTLSGIDKQDVNEDKLVEALKLVNFTISEAEYYKHEAMRNGEIYERRSGFYAKP